MLQKVFVSCLHLKALRIPDIFCITQIRFKMQIYYNHLLQGYVQPWDQQETLRYKGEVGREITTFSTDSKASANLDHNNLETMFFYYVSCYRLWQGCIFLDNRFQITHFIG